MAKLQNSGGDELTLSAHHSRSLGEMSWWEHAQQATTPLIVVRALIRNRPRGEFQQRSEVRIVIGAHIDEQIDF